MGGPLSVILSDTTRIENNLVKPEKQLFYGRFAEDTINRRKKNENDSIFENCNKYHPKLTSTIEVIPPSFSTPKALTIKKTSLSQF